MIKKALPLLLINILAADVLAAKLETIMVYGERSQRLLSETASLAHLVDEEVLEHPGIEHASQVLSPTPGVWVSRGSGQEQLVAIRSPVFTGAGACGAFWLAEDGIALRATGFCNANEFFDSHYEAAEQIEVFKGPHASIVGGNAQYGALNVRLPAARDVHDEIALNTNTLGYRRLQIQTGGEAGSHAFGALATGIEDDAVRADSGFKQQKLSLRHGWQGDEWASVENGLTLMHLEQETATYIEGEDSYRVDTLRYGNTAPEAYRDVDALRVFSRWRWRQLDSEWSFTPYARSNRMNFLMHFVDWQPTEKNGHDSVGWQLQWRRFLAQGTELYWSQEFEQTWGEMLEVQMGESPFAQAQIPPGVHYDYHVRARTAAVNVGAFWQTTRNLALDLAVRWDHTYYDYSNRTNAGSACAPEVNGCRFYRPETQNDHFSEPSLHAGFVYHWQNGLYAFGKLANGFRIPQTAELYRISQPAEIEPEKITSAEAGLRGQWGGFFMQSAIYAMRNRDGIFQDADRRYINGADTEHLGLEYQLEYATDLWQLTLAGQVADHTYTNNPFGGINLSGNELDTAPQHMHQLSGRWQIAPRISLGAQWTYMGSYYLEEQNRFEYPGHDLLDLDIRTELSKRLTLHWALLNVTDREYAERADWAFGEYRYFPGLERRISLSVKYKF